MRGLMCVIAPDGHVATREGGVWTAPRITLNVAVMQAAGFAGYTAARLPFTEALIRHAAHYDCPRCVMRYPCGCTSDQIEAGTCTHDATGNLIRAALRVARLSPCPYVEGGQITFSLARNPEEPR